MKTLQVQIEGSDRISDEQALKVICADLLITSHFLTKEGVKVAIIDGAN